MELITLMVAGSNGSSLTLPINLGTLGGDVVYAGRVLDALGNLAIASRTAALDVRTVPSQGNLISPLNDEDDHSAELWQVVLSIPAGRFTS